MSAALAPVGFAGRGFALQAGSQELLIGLGLGAGSSGQAGHGFQQGGRPSTPDPVPLSR